MLKTENKGYVNSLTGNDCESDLYSNNYLAFARYIAGIECDGEITFPTFTQCCSAYGISDRNKLNDNNKKVKKNTRNYKKNTNNVFRVTNIITNEIHNCQCNDEVAEITGMNKCNVSVYCKSGIAYKKTYKIERLTEFDHNYKNKPLIVKNTKNGKITNCNSVKETAEFLGIKRESIDYHIKKGYYKHFKLEYKNKEDRIVEKLVVKYKSKTKKIICVNNGKVFNNSVEAAKHFNISSKSNILRCCKGLVNSAGKHPETKEKLKWKFMEEK